MEQTNIWRRSYDIPPPPLALDDPRNPAKDPRYAALKPEEIPLTECLKDTVERFMPHWRETIAPALREGKRDWSRRTAILCARWSNISTASLMKTSSD